MPPSALISSQARVRPFLNSTPSAAAKSVSGAACPTGIGSPSARAPSLRPASTAPPAPKAAAPFMKTRRLGMTLGFASFGFWVLVMFWVSLLGLLYSGDRLNQLGGLGNDRLLMRLQPHAAPIRHQRRPGVGDMGPEAR